MRIMGAIIESVGFSKRGINPFRNGSVDLEVKAARTCLKRASLSPKSIGILVNTGIYRDKFIGEPSIASFIQRRIGANPLFDGGNGTFSFDLSNGGCGFLTGMEVLGGFISSGSIERGMVVTGDTDPSPRSTVGFDFVPAAAAVILARGRRGEGFSKFETITYPEYENLFVSRVEWTGDPKDSASTKKKRNILVMEEDERFLEKCVESSLRSVEGFLKDTSLEPDMIDLVIASQYPANFTSMLAEELDWKEKIMDVAGRYGNLHTAGPGAALESACENGRFAGSKNILFLAVGSGITVSMAHYRNAGLE